MKEPTAEEQAIAAARAQGWTDGYKAGRDQLDAACLLELAELQKQLDVEVTVGARLVDENEELRDRITELEAEIENLQKTT